MKPGDIVYRNDVTIVWAGTVYEHLYAVLSDGRTYRLEVQEHSTWGPTEEDETWKLVSHLPFNANA